MSTDSQSSLSPSCTSAEHLLFSTSPSVTYRCNFKAKSDHNSNPKTINPYIVLTALASPTYHCSKETTYHCNVCSPETTYRCNVSSLGTTNRCNVSSPKTTYHDNISPSESTYHYILSPIYSPNTSQGYSLSSRHPNTALAFQLVTPLPLNVPSPQSTLQSKRWQQLLHHYPDQDLLTLLAGIAQHGIQVGYEGPFMYL